MNATKIILANCILAMTLSGCQKEIQVDLPEGEEKLVVEGTIELGSPPFVILTKTQSFFEPTDLNSLVGIFVKGATITVSDGTSTVTLDQLCSSNIPDTLIPAAAVLTGLDPDLLAAADICLYLDASGILLGEVGKTYDLRVESGGTVATSSSTMTPVVELDSVWFRLAQQDANNDTSGYIWGRLNDPPGVPNFYRWQARRINLDDSGQPKDPFFIAPLGGSFSDQFFDGLLLDFFAVRGNANSGNDGNDFNNFFNRGDTVVTKLINLGRSEYDFYFTFDNNVATQGDLFSSPSNVVSNINGGLGVWAALAPAYDTLVCIP